MLREDPDNPHRTCPECDGCGYLVNPWLLHEYRVECTVCYGEGVLRIKELAAWILKTAMARPARARA